MRAFRERVFQAAPRIIAFTGKKAAAVYFGTSTDSLAFGLSSERLGDIKIFVLPSTSGAASRYWSEGPWRDLAGHMVGGG